MSTFLKSAIVLLSVVSAVREAGAAPACENVFSRGLELVSSHDLDKTVIPASVSAFLAANPAYRNTFEHFPTMESAYFLGRVASDWASYRAHIPASSKSVLDIGSGVGAINLMVYHALDNPRITMVDKASREQDGAVFNVNKSSIELLTVNGARRDRVRAIDAKDPALEAKIAATTYDVIYSLRGLGYMFPYSYYRDVIKASLKTGGVLILDFPVKNHEDQLISGRFAEDGSPTIQAVFDVLREDLGEPEIIQSGKVIMRVKVVRTTPLSSK